MISPCSSPVFGGTGGGDGDMGAGKEGGGLWRLHRWKRKAAAMTSWMGRKRRAALVMGSRTSGISACSGVARN